MRWKKNISLKMALPILGVYATILLVLGYALNSYFLLKNDPMLRLAEDYKQMIKMDSGNAEVHSKLGDLYLEIFDNKKDVSYLQKAKDEFKAASELYPKNSNYRYSLASVYKDLKDIKRAMAEFKKILKYDPLHSQANVDLARLYAAKKDYKKAEFHYNKCLEKEQTAANVYFELGQLYEVQKRDEEALRMYQLARTYDPTIKGLSEKLKGSGTNK